MWAHSHLMYFTSWNPILLKNTNILKDKHLLQNYLVTILVPLFYRAVTVRLRFHFGSVLDEGPATLLCICRKEAWIAKEAVPIFQSLKFLPLLSSILRTQFVLPPGSGLGLIQLLKHMECQCFHLITQVFNQVLWSALDSTSFFWVTPQKPRQVKSKR